MAEIKGLRLNKREAKAMLDPRDPPCWHRKSTLRAAAEFKLRQAIWGAYPELREGKSEDRP